MNSMKKKLAFAFGVTTALTLISVIVYQTDVISTLTKNLKAETRRANSAELELGVKNKMVEELSLENAQLRDSIEVLHLEIAHLNETIATQQSAIAKLNRTIKSHEENVAQLTRNIEKLKKSGAANQQKISQLENERAGLLIKMEEYDHYRRIVKEQEVKLHQQQEIERKKLEEAQAKLENHQPIPSGPAVAAPPVNLNRPPSNEPAAAATPAGPSHMADVIKNKQQEQLMVVKAKTTVNFSDITLRKKETGNDLKKIDAKDWRYTFIEFDLDNPQKDLILEETFVLQIFDLDQNQVVPMNENNPEFPESEQGRTGYKFRYKGAPLSIRYYNNQRKEGVNYEIRLYYLKGGLFFPLDHGSKRIVQNGEVLIP
jgi:hypothetical protein